MIEYRAAKDIPDPVFLAAVEMCHLISGGNYATRWDVEALLGAQRIPRENFSDDVPGVPAKVVLAKFRRLEKRGLLHGCDCSCRGDWYLTDAGKLALTLSEGMRQLTEQITAEVDEQAARYARRVSWSNDDLCVPINRSAETRRHGPVVDAEPKEGLL